MTEPNEALAYVRPDEIAECWDIPEVTEELRRKLWASMAHAAPIPNLEDSGPHDHVGHASVKSLWAHFDEETHQQINRAAVAWEAEIERLFGQFPSPFDHDHPKAR